MNAIDPRVISHYAAGPARWAATSAAGVSAGHGQRVPPDGQDEGSLHELFLLPTLIGAGRTQAPVTFLYDGGYVVKYSGRTAGR